MTVKARISSDGNFNTAGELFNYPAILKGGRNLFKKTTTLSALSGTTTRTHDASINGFRVTATTDKATIRIGNIIRKNGNFTFSAYVKSSVPFTLNMDINDSTPSPNTFAIGTAWVRVVSTRKVENATAVYNFIDISSLPAGGVIDFKDVKVEEGTTATPWTPAPEDLGLSYPDHVQSFGLNLSENIITQEIVELPDELFAGNRNIAKRTWLTGWNGSYVYSGGVYNLSGGSNGIKLNASMFKPKTKYVLSFMIKKISGSVETIGGHAQLFSSSQTYIDGNSISGTWSSGDCVYTNDNLEHYCEVVFITGSMASGDLNLYIQPNRGNGYSYSYNVELWDLKVEESADRATVYTAPPEDLGVILPDWVKSYDNPLSIHAEGIILNGQYSEAPDALNFDGSGYITINNPLYNQPNLEQEWTVEAEVRLNSDSTGTQHLVEGMNSGLRVSQGTMPLLYLNSGTNDYYAYGNKDIRDNRYYTISFVFKNSTGFRQIFLDGADATDRNGPNKTQKPSGMSKSLTIGSNVRGSLKSLRIWDRVLTQEEVKANLNKTLKGNETGLVGYWKFVEGHGDILTDFSPNQNHGIINGATWVYSINE